MVVQEVWKGHKISISVSLSPKKLFLASENIVSVDGKEVARFGEFSFRNYVASTFDHCGETTTIEIETKAGLFLPTYLIKINEQVAMQGYLGAETIGSMRIYFGVFGLGYVSSLIHLVSPIFRNTNFQMYNPFWFVAGAIIDAIFGALLIYFAISIKSLLLKSLHLITTVLYIRIGFMIAKTPLLILDSIQGINTEVLEWRLRIGLHLMYTWLFGYMLVNCKRLSKELR